MDQERHKDDSIYVALFSKDFEGLCQTSLPAKMLFTMFLELVGFTSIVQNRKRDGSPHKEPTRKTSTSSKLKILQQQEVLETRRQRQLFL